MNIPRPVACFQQKNPTGPYIMTFAPGLKALKTPITIKPLLKKILPQMLFKIGKGDFSRRKMFVFFLGTLFFAVQKRPKE